MSAAIVGAVTPGRFSARAGPGLSGVPADPAEARFVRAMRNGCRRRRASCQSGPGCRRPSPMTPGVRGSGMRRRVRTSIVHIAYRRPRIKAYRGAKTQGPLVGHLSADWGLERRRMKTCVPWLLSKGTTRGGIAGVAHPRSPDKIEFPHGHRDRACTRRYRQEPRT